MSRREGKPVPPFILRDLRNVIDAPFLLKKKPVPDLAHHPETTALLAALEKNPAPLADYFSAGVPHRLGHYFERLVIFWLENLPSVTLVAANLPVYEGKRTIGELDLLFRHGGALYHWELAVKFYLNIGNPRHEAAYVGPSLKDSLARKLKRMFDHQLPLAGRLSHPPFHSELGIESAPHSSAFVKGWLFQPFSLGAVTALPRRVAPDCLQGHWYSIDELAGASLPEFDHFRLLKKPRWLTPFFFPREVSAGGDARLIHVLEAELIHKHAPQLVTLLKKTGDNRLEEVTKIFVTPSDWLPLAREAHPGERFGD